MKVRQFDIEGPLLIEPKRFHDARGYFCETYNAAALAQHGVTVNFVQDNLSLSTASGTVRGLHFQAPPFAQDKLVRVVRGAILDVAVDIRAGSPTFGKHVSVELSAENGFQLFIPAGFAHGFATLRPLTELAYKVSAPYSADHDGGIFWDDPSLRIGWSISVDDAVLSAKDEALPLLREIKTPFVYKGTESGVAA
jgi:dTDP-4-dehydrorhamnose 3,5-epimerase